MMFGMMFLWIAIVALIAFAARSGRRGDASGGYQSPSAGEILEERFARAEISEEEFEGRKQALARRVR